MTITNQSIAGLVVVSDDPTSEAQELAHLFRQIDRKVRSTGKFSLILELDRLAEMRGIDNTDASIALAKIADSI